MDLSVAEANTDFKDEGENKTNGVNYELTVVGENTGFYMCANRMCRFGSEPEVDVYWPTGARTRSFPEYAGNFDEIETAVAEIIGEEELHRTEIRPYELSRQGVVYFSNPGGVVPASDISRVEVEVQDIPLAWQDQPGFGRIMSVETTDYDMIERLVNEDSLSPGEDVVEKFVRKIEEKLENHQFDFKQGSS